MKIGELITDNFDDAMVNEIKKISKKFIINEKIIIINDEKKIIKLIYKTDKNLGTAFFNIIYLRHRLHELGVNLDLFELKLNDIDQSAYNISVKKIDLSIMPSS